MRFQHDGIALWLEPVDTIPGDTVAVGSKVSVTVGVEPANASNRVELHYRVNRGPTAKVSADAVNHIGTKQYFRATIPDPVFRAGDLVDYGAVCRCVGRQVPSAGDEKQLPLSFRVLGTGIGPQPADPHGQVGGSITAAPSEPQPQLTSASIPLFASAPQPTPMSPPASVSTLPRPP